MKKKILGPEFFDRSALVVARELIGKFLVRKVGERGVTLMITETEVYHGLADGASKARRGETPSNAPMFMHAGTIYVYFTYGMHWMLNLVCGKAGFPSAVLIRGVQTDTTHSRTRVCECVVLEGPAKLTKFLQIDKTLNTLPLGKKSGLWVEDRRVNIRPRDIKRTGRIGVDYSGVWAKKPWRFVLVAHNKQH